MRNFPAIVSSQAILEIVGQANIEPVRMIFGRENVDIGEAIHRRFGPSPL
jgi:hypothetical protein